MFSGPTFKLFDVFGIRVGAHWTLAIALAMAGVTYGGVAGIILSVLLFASILAHEIGHALVARGRGVKIAGIDLHMFGGTALMASAPRTNNDEIAIAIAGPLVSFALAALAFGAMHVVAAPWLVWLASANAMLGAFNLVPALPMDGGRVLRALLAKRKGYVDATRIAVTVARVCSVGMGILGVVTHGWMLVALAILVWSMGTRELRSVT